MYSWGKTEYFIQIDSQVVLFLNCKYSMISVGSKPIATKLPRQS